METLKNGHLSVKLHSSAPPPPGSEATRNGYVQRRFSRCRCNIASFKFENNKGVQIFKKVFGSRTLKGTSGRKKKLSSTERAWKCKKTSHHRPQCAKWFSRYTISKSGIWARWTSPFCRFSASFSIKYDVTDAILEDNEKMKMQYLRSLPFYLFETLKAVRTWQRNFASFQILLLWQPESKLLSIIEKTKGLFFKQKCCSKSNLKQYSLIGAAGSIKFWRKMGEKHSSCEKTIVFCFQIKANYSRLSCHSNEI